MKKNFVINVVSILLSMNMFSQGNLPKDLQSKIDKEITINSNIAIDYFDEYLKQYPKSDYLIGLKAYYMCFYQSKDDALSFLKNSLINNKLLDESTYVNLAYGAIKNLEGENQEAQKYFLKSIDLDYEKLNKWAFLELYYLNERADSLVALEFLQKSLKLDSCFATGLYELSINLYQRRQFVEALEIINKCIDCSPSFIQAFNQKALTFIELKKYNDAINTYNQVRTIEKSDIEATLGLGYVYQYFIIDHDLSEKYYFEAIKVDTNNFAALKGIGMIKSEKKECEKAIYYLQKALSINEDNEVELDLLYCLIAEKRIKEASELCAKLFKNPIKDRRLLLFDILIDYLSGKTNFVIEKVNQFKQTHSSDDFFWLEEQLKYWNIELIPQ